MGCGQFEWGSTLQEGWRKGPWTAQEDKLLVEHVRLHGEGRWNCVSKLTGLKRSGKSCRLRWVNYLRPDLKRGKITPQEESIIIELHARWGNRWSTIARSLPGRTDNEIKNYWRTHFKKGKSSKNLERARLLMKQQQQKEQQLQKEEEQEKEEEEQEAELQHQMVVDMKKLMPQLEEYEYRASLAQDMQAEMAFMCPTPSYYYSMFLQGAGDDQLGTAAAATTTTTDGFGEEATWGCLWNLDDVHGDMHDVYRTSTNDLHLPGQVASF